MNFTQINVRRIITMAVKPIPEGHHTVTPYLVVPKAVQLIDFMKQAFAAEEIQRFTLPDGSIMHAEVRIGDSRVMLGEAGGEYAPMPAMLHLYVEDVDAVYQQALQAGAASLREPADQPDGDRRGGVKDQSGNQWWIATHIEDVSPEELAKREEAQRKQGQQKGENS
jgi:PhnB protein